MSIHDMEDLKQQYLDEIKTLINGKDYRNGKIDIEIKINELKENFNGMSIEINKKKQLQQLEQYTIAIILDLPTEEPDNSLSMGDEHVDIIPETESDELIKSSDENLIPIPSESDDFYDIESKCDVPDCDDSQTTNFSTFSNPLFDDSTSSDDESSHEDVINEISFKTYSNPLSDLDEEIISSEFNPIHNEDLDSTPKNDRFNTESYLRESLLNRDTLMASSPKIDSLLDEFAGELIKIPPRIVNREHEEYISLMEREEIDIFPGPDDSIPPGIESDDYDSKCNDNSTSLPEFESFHVDYPDSRDSTIDVVEDIPVDIPDLGSDLDVSSTKGDRKQDFRSQGEPSSFLGVLCCDVQDYTDFEGPSRYRGVCLHSLEL
ncbi:hypothetical protein Tco_0892544 [Tanacetum coccineum]|uniref:Uncharacterized protein n=1 Tax=Tanacetum coccineum TaxID=301880 RepID=A0ABQ5C8Y8_9ASTR